MSSSNSIYDGCLGLADWVASLKLVELKSELKKRSQKCTGNKGDLQMCLHDFISGPDMEEITRCICDFLHDDGYMISCDKCS